MRTDTQMMLFCRRGLAAAFAGALAALIAVAVRGAAPVKPAPKIGTVHFTFGHMSTRGDGKTNLEADFTGGVRIWTDVYELTCPEARSTGWPIPKAVVTAVGNADHPVTVKFEGQTEGETTQIQSYRAVMEAAPTPDQPGREKVTFTDHVIMTATSASLQAPSVTHMRQAVVYIGPGPDYPQIEADDVDGSATPVPGRD